MKIGIMGMHYGHISGMFHSGGQRAQMVKSSAL